MQDVLEILLEQNDGRWTGTLAQLLVLVKALEPTWNERRLGIELRRVEGITIKQSRKRTESGVLRVLEILTDPGGILKKGGDPYGSGEADEVIHVDQGGDPYGSGEDLATDPGALTLAYISPPPDSVDIQQAIQVLHPNTPVELRLLNATKPGVDDRASGVFDSPTLAAEAAKRWDGCYKGLYYTLNPTGLPVTNRIAKAIKTTSDKDIHARRWLLIDVEGSRPEPKQTNATDQEVLAAIELAERIRATVTECRPLALCSGNGCHLLYRYDLPNDEASRTLVAGALKGLAHHYNNDKATVDTTVGNASRISKLPGTMTMKGPDLPDRPQRRSFVLDWGVSGLLSPSTIQQWASLAPEASAKPEKASSISAKVKMDRVERARLWLAKREPAIANGTGNDWTFKTAAEVMIEFDLTTGQTLDALSDWAARCNPPWEHSELSEVVANAEKYATGVRGKKLEVKPPGIGEEELPQDEQLLKYHWNDEGNARRLIYLYGDKIRWCEKERKWYVWLGSHWKQDSKTKALAWANKTMLRCLAATELIEEKEERKKAHSFFKGCLNAARRDTCLAQVKAWQTHVIDPDELNSDPWLLNVNNGTFNLRKGILQQHRQADLITRIVSCDYDPIAQCPRWSAFLAQMLPEQGLMDYVQRAVGYSLNGSVREHAMFICYGTGRNGKSVFLNVLGKLLSEYSWSTQATTFQDMKPETIRADLVALCGRRLVRCSETKDGFKFDEGIVKQITGGDTISARSPYGQLFEFKPTFKIWLATNYKPRIQGSDMGIWRRLRLIPWKVQVAEEDQDKDLEEKLCQELPGILNWALQGHLAWQQGGLQEPQIVKDELEEYRRTSDMFGLFVEECCQVGQLFSETSKVLYSYFSEWLKGQGEYVYSQRRMSDWLEAKGFKKHRFGKLCERGYIGLRINLNLQPESDQMDERLREELDRYIDEII